MVPNGLDDTRRRRGSQGPRVGLGLPDSAEPCLTCTGRLQCRQFNAVNALKGYPPVEIRSPAEVVYGTDEDEDI